MTDPNKTRARRALKSVNFYRSLTHQDRTTGGTALCEGVIDLVTDIRHLCNQKGIEWDRIVRCTDSHFHAEVHGEE
jgi:hypothetical protein